MSCAPLTLIRCYMLFQFCLLVPLSFLLCNLNESIYSTFFCSVSVFYSYLLSNLFTILLWGVMVVVLLLCNSTKVNSVMNWIYFVCKCMFRDHLCYFLYVNCAKKWTKMLIWFLKHCSFRVHRSEQNLIDWKALRNSTFNKK